MHTNLCSWWSPVDLTVEFEPTEHAISETDSFVQLVVKSSVPANFDYNVVVTTADISATGKACSITVIVSCMYIRTCVYMVCICSIY